MGVDQGRTGNVPALAILAEERGDPVEAVGTTTFRPPYAPVPFGVVAGRWIAAAGPNARALAAWQGQGRAVATVRWLGRNSLVLYLVPQPVFFALLSGAAYVRAPTLHTDVTMDIRGPFARVTVRQTFRN